MNTRRAVLGAMAGAGVVSLAGCALLQDTIEESAQTAGVADPALSKTGYNHNRTEEQSIERTVEAGGESRDIKLTNYLVEYVKGLESVGDNPATFQLFSTPGVKIAGNDVNPLKALDERALLQTAFGQSGQNLSKTGTQSVTVLGKTVSFTQYETTSSMGGQDFTAVLHFGRVTQDSDQVTMLGVHPKQVKEGNNVYRLASDVMYPKDVPTSSGTQSNP